MENFEKPDTKEFIHQLIQNEFRDALTSIGYELPTNTEDVIVLSAGEFVLNEDETIDYSLPANHENKARIEMGIEIIKQIVAVKSNKPLDEIVDGDVLQYAPTLILSGTTEQLRVMKQLVEELGFPVAKIEQVDCGAAGVGNTKTQFETINEHFKNNKPQHVTFISSDYHVPRVERTGFKKLDPKINFDVIPVPHKDIPYDVFKVVRGEVRRIIAYADKGDIAKNILPRQ